MGRAALFLVSGFLIIFGMVQNSVQNRQQALAERSPKYYHEEQSRNIAASMTEVALKKLNDNLYSPYSAEDSINILGGTGVIEHYQAPQNFNSTVFLEIRGIAGPTDSQTTTKIQIVANRPAFSIYAYFTNEEKTPNGNAIYFTTGDILNGPVHTNGKFRIQGDPIFNGPITSHDGVYKSSGSNPTFNDKQDFNARKIDLPNQATEAIDLAKTQNGGIGEFNDNIFVEFKQGNSSTNNDGTVEISELACKSSFFGNCFEYYEAPDPTTTVTHNLADFNGVISTRKDLYVKGKVDGQVTINAENDVKIMGDIEYENRNYNDNSQPISDDQLGIVSGDNTIVDKNAHKDNGSQDINIDATVTALNGSFRVEDYNDYVNKGIIHLLGGLIQRTRGPVGLVNGAGYSKDYTYDSRFQKNSTPGFPKIKRFDIESWRETTTKSSNY